MSSWFFLVFVRHLVLPSRAATVATLPSALFGERFGRSVQVGCSRFSRCGHLFIDLPPISKMEVGPGVWRSHRNSALGFVLLSICRNYAAAGSRARLRLRNGS
jgi:hypothetical protein